MLNEMGRHVSNSMSAVFPSLHENFSNSSSIFKILVLVNEGLTFKTDFVDEHTAKVARRKIKNNFL